VAGGKAFEGVTLLVQIGKEAPDVPALDLARGQRQPSFLALDLEEILEPRIIAAGRWIWIMCQPPKPLQKAAGDGVKLFLRPARGGSSSLCYAPGCPRSGEGIEAGSPEAMVPRPPLDLTRDAEAVASLPEHGAQSGATISKILQIFKSFRGQRPSTMSLKNSRI